MAKAGWEVTVLEKHAIPGGRARQLLAEGFTFDMGPSWYWMPDVFERYFEQFSKKTSDYYALTRLDPSYRIYFPDGPLDIPADFTALKKLFESIEEGAGEQLEKFMSEAARKYAIGIKKLVFKPGLSLSEFLDIDLMKGLLKLDVFSSMRAHVARYFRHPKLVEMMEFPVLFLGALPEHTPALYSLMNYADIKGGTWYPRGGMFQIVKGMHALATELGVQFKFNEEVKEIKVAGGIASGLVTVSPKGEEKTYRMDAIIGGADYHHIETTLLPAAYRTYSERYWEKRVMAPGCLLYYVGLNKKIKNLQHHTLFFDSSFAVHGNEIYTNKKWPTNPLFYVSATSVTDPSLAPEGCENLFLLIPVAAGLEGDTEELRQKYFELILDRMEQYYGQPIRDAVIYQKSFAQKDFISEYHAFKGNAYGLANTLGQTAVLKPSCKSKKVNNLFYTGQLTIPGPGVPPSLISGEVVAGVVLKQFGYKKYAEKPVVENLVQE
ncbi:MAG: phytoene desaturase [Bacteroidota bacterium]